MLILIGSSGPPQPPAAPDPSHPADQPPPACPGLPQMQPDRVTASGTDAHRAAAHKSGGSLFGDFDSFVKGVGAGAWDGVKGMATGVVALGRGAYHLATSAQARSSAWNATVRDAKAAGHFTATAVTDPAKAASEVRGVARAEWDKVSTAYREAAASGHGAEFIGKLFGQGAVLVGSALVPGGAEADIAVDGARAAEVAQGFGDTSEAANVLGRTAEVTSDAGRSDVTTVYRVEGAGNQRVVLGADGGVDIPTVTTRSGAERNLYLNFGDEDRARVFLSQHLGQFPDTTIKQFDVPQSFVEELRAEAVPESLRARNPLQPVIADPTKAADQFGLAGPQITRLREVIIQGTGRLTGD